MPPLAIRRSFQGLVYLAVIAMSLLVGIVLQQMSLALTVFACGVSMLWLAGAIGMGMNLGRCLAIISTFFLYPFEITFYLALALLVLCLLGEYYQSRDIRLQLPFPRLFLVLGSFGVLGLTKTNVEGGSLYFISTILVPLICFLVVSNSRNNLLDLDIWMRGITLAATLVAIYGIGVALANPYQRIGSTWSNAMTINGFYTVAFFFALALGIKSSVPRNRGFWITASGLIFLGMMFTYTRIAIVAVVFGLLMLMWKAKRLRIWGLAALGVLPLIIPASMMKRGEVAGLMDISILIRLLAWYNAAKVIASHPLAGIGFSTWKALYKSMVPLPALYAQHTHNLYINLMVEMGIFGTLAYLGIVFGTLVRYWQKVVKPHKDLVSYMVFVAVLSLLVACLTDIFVQQYTVSLLFWITLALLNRQSVNES